MRPYVTHADARSRVAARVFGEPNLEQRAERAEADYHLVVDEWLRGRSSSQTLLFARVEMITAWSAAVDARVASRRGPQADGQQA